MGSNGAGMGNNERQERVVAWTATRADLQRLLVSIQGLLIGGSLVYDTRAGHEQARGPE
jgi:hypothetical protein